MLHWPDSMFTYVKEAKTLLPNDAFGQHLATSRRFADEVDPGVLMEEASKYYANILMPFGGPIEKMLDKIGEMGLEIEAIGPSHGVIWRTAEDVARILEAYGRWSRFEAPRAGGPHLRHHVALHREDDHGHRGRRGPGGRGMLGATG